MGVDTEIRAQIMKLKRTELCDAVIGGFDLIVSRTGYTGEKMAFELFVHPERAVDFWNGGFESGRVVRRESRLAWAREIRLRTEAGLPLYGHEMGLGSITNVIGWGKFTMPTRDLGVAEGGFGSYVKTVQAVVHRAGRVRCARERTQGRGDSLHL
jgi:glycine hydroxymethyltransferase